MEKRDEEAKDSAMTTEEDRLSMLPDGLLIRILSFVDTKHAVQTCALSKRWINIWTSVSNLTFNSALFKKISSFTKFIDQVLILRDDSVKVISLNFSYPRAFGRYISWHEDEYMLLPFQRVINYAEAHGVQDLNFFIKKYGPSTFSEFLYSCSSLRTLSVRISGLLENFEKTFCFKHLMTLHLEHAWLVESNPFSGCLNLEDLTLIDCSSCSSYCALIISAPKLSRVTISSLSPYYTINDIVFSTHKLTSFNYHGCFPPLLSPNDLPLLDTVTINLDADRVVYKEKRGIDLINTLKVLHNSKSLILSRGAVELLSTVAHKLALEASPISNLKRLSFITADGRDSYNIPSHVMTYLLKDTPNAEVVVKLPRSTASTSAARDHLVDVFGTSVNTAAYLSRELSAMPKHSVQDLNFSIKKYGPSTFAEFLYSCTSLRTLSLRVIGPLENFEKAFCFKQLMTLRLEGVWLIESNPFSGCPNLEDLTLIDCDSGSSYRALIISAPKLSRLTIISSKSYGYGINDIVLSTHKLTSFNYNGCLPPLLSPNDLPLLDTLTINLYVDRVVNKEKHGIDLINTLKGLHNVKSLILSRGTVELLSRVRDKLALEASPISNLKHLSFIRSKGSDSYNIPASM